MDLFYLGCPFCSRGEIWFDGELRHSLMVLEKRTPCPDWERIAKAKAWHEIPVAMVKKNGEESAARAAAAQHARMWCR